MGFFIWPVPGALKRPSPNEEFGGARILDCIDNAGGAVALGEYFMIERENGEHESMECIGDELHAKKVVFKCELCLSTTSQT